MSTKRQKWSQERNWLLFILKGMRLSFSHYNTSMYSLLPKEKRYIVDKVYSYLSDLIEELSKSKYKE